jgi:DNA-binding transcriptional LysR family regulator
MNDNASYMTGDVLDLARLRYFVAVAEELHFTRAAERLSIAQPALSVHIRRLERELGAPLFERTRRSVRLTEGGAVLLRHARALLDGSAVAQREFTRTVRGEAGRIAIAFAPTVGASLLPAAFRAYRERFPDVTVELREIGARDTLMDLLLRDAVQIVIGQRLDPEGRTLRAERVLSERFSAVGLPAAHPLAVRRRRSVELRELWGERLITSPASNPYIAELIAVAAAAGASPQLMPASDATTRLVLVAAGVGVTLLLPSAPRIVHPGIAYRRLVGAPITIEVCATIRADETRPHVRAFLSAIRAAGRSSMRTRDLMFTEETRGRYAATPRAQEHLIEARPKA